MNDRVVEFDGVDKTYPFFKLLSGITLLFGGLAIRRLARVG